MKTLIAALALSAMALPHAAQAADKGNGPYRYVIVPKVVHPWFDVVVDGAKQTAQFLKTSTGADVKIEYTAPQKADVVEQNDIIERAIATHPDGIAVDLLDGSGNKAVLQEAIDQGIPVVLFDSITPAGLNLTAINTDFCEQANMASEQLVKAIGGEGEVAIMMGVPTAPNHAMHVKCEEAFFAKYPKIKVVAKGIDNDDIQTAQKQAAAIMQANPNLKGWVVADAAGPIGVGQAIKEADKKGKVKLIALEDLPEIIKLVKDGTAESTMSQKPLMEGRLAVLTLWMQNHGMATPKTIDTGIDFITTADVQKGYTPK